MREESPRVEVLAISCSDSGIPCALVGLGRYGGGARWLQVMYRDRWVAELGPGMLFHPQQGLTVVVTKAHPAQCAAVLFNSRQNLRHYGTLDLG